MEFLALLFATWAWSKIDAHSHAQALIRRKQKAELLALEPPKSADQWEPGFLFRRRKSPPRPKTRKQLVDEAKELLNEELRFCKLITDSVARQAAENSAHARFGQRLREIMEGTSK